MKDVLQRCRTATVFYLLSAFALFSPVGGFAVLSAHAQEADVTVAAETPAPEEAAPAPVEEPAAETAQAPAPAEETVEAPASSETTEAAPADTTEEAAPADASDEAASSDAASTVSSDADASAPEAPVETLSQNAPELSTDKADYAPGETVTIFGRFFSALQDIALTIFGGSAEAGDYTETTVVTTTDDQGSFSLAHLLEDVFRPLYTVIARTLSGETLATTTFTDAVSTSFSQCSNNNPTAGSCNWIGSIVQQSNSVYYEGMTVPQRLLFRDVASNGTHTVSFTYQYTKAGIHAYDFLSTVNPYTGIAQGNAAFTPGTPTLNPCSDLTGPDLTACTGLNPAGVAPTLVAVPTDTFDSKDSAPGAGTGTSQAAKEAAYATANGPRNIAVYATTGAFSSPSVTLSHSGAADSDTGDSDVTVTLTFTSSGCSTANKCKFAFYFGGHLAVTGADNTTGSNWGPGFGSSQISGGPYHIKSVKFDGTGGSQDNQIKGADILPPPPQGTLSGVKFNDLDGNGVKDPTDPPIAGWTIDLSGTASATTTTDANGIYTFADLADGSYTVCEGTQSGWTQTYPASGTACGNGTMGYTLAVSGVTNATDLDFGNVQLGSITIDKVTLPSGDPQSFSFTLAGPTPGTASLTDAAAPAVITSAVAGSYTLTEASLAGWTLTGATCTGVTATPVTGGVSFTLPAGGSASCTFTNAKAAKLTVVKQVVNDDGGTLTASSFPLFVDGSPVTSGASNVTATGTHTVSETSQAGYTQTSIGGDCAANGSVTLNPGDDKTCVITNNDQPGSLTVIKTVTNDNGGTLTASDFTMNVAGGNVSPSSAFPGNATGTTVTMNAGTYSVTELSVAGYVGSASADCSGTIANGQSKTCTITNDDVQPTLTLVKTVVNNNGGTLQVSDFPLNISGNPTTSGASNGLNAGSYTAGEQSAFGYSASAWGGDCAADGSVSLSVGENKTCTITNDDVQPTLTLVKTVTNDNGGTLQVSDFPLNISGNPTTSGASNGLNAGSY
ncbi:MAG TPA: SdrD B-like domain-containing protein, partial [Candidatus Eisenbacteria bacterium]|nr:SdrD B-like domain-containing protein [Candidatus Eisenbacteria bacterium]